MNSVSTLSFDINTTDPTSAVSIAVWVNETCIYQTNHLLEPHKVKYEVGDETEGDYILRIVMSDKTAEHTKVDSDGNILKDVLIELSNFDIDGIDVNQLFQDKIVYTHNFNGTQPEIKDSFHGFMGCNGELTLNFSTPMYLWLLENM
jgi:hypothetical protein